MTVRSQNKEKGVSLIELMIVVAVTLIVGAMAFPSFINATYNMRLRSSAYELSGMFQATRMQAIRDNKPYYLCYGNVNGATMAWISETCGTAPGAGQQTAQLGGNVRILTTTGGSPAALDSTALGFAPPTAGLLSAKPMFGPRGLPCYKSSATATCNTAITGGLSGNQIVTQLLYLTDTRPFGANGWAAVAASPAGRVQVWTYNGSSWVK